MNGYVKNAKALGNDTKELWEMLIQRGFTELEEYYEPSLAGCVHLTCYDFCRYVFDPGGNPFRLEVESSQEGGDDTRSVALICSSKQVNDQVHFKFKYGGFFMKISNGIDIEVKLQSKELKIQLMEMSLKEIPRNGLEEDRPYKKAGS